MKAYIRRTVCSRRFLWDWVRVGVYELSDGTQERFIWLRLPSYGMMYCINTDDFQWGQRVLMYRGRSGFQIWPYFPAQQAQ